MKTIILCSTAVLALLAFCPSIQAEVTFTLLNDTDNIGLLPQPKAQIGLAGDHVIQTADDITGTTFNPGGCFSFNFTNPGGELLPDYPHGYAENIHSMTGSFQLDVNLVTGGGVAVDALMFDGYVAPNKFAYQHLVNPGDPAADGNHGPIDGQPNAGSYTASAEGNWALDLSVDWYYDTPFAGYGGIDMTFNDYAWAGFIIPVNQLTPTGLAQTTLNDPLDYFDGSSDDFESWLLGKIVPSLPDNATWLFFAQGEAHPDWTNPSMGMTTDGLVAETIIAYTCAVPEPSTVALILTGLGLAALRGKACRTR